MLSVETSVKYFHNVETGLHVQKLCKLDKMCKIDKIVEQLCLMCKFVHTKWGELYKAGLHHGKHKADPLITWQGSLSSVISGETS